MIKFGSDWQKIGETIKCRNHCHGTLIDCQTFSNMFVTNNNEQSCVFKNEKGRYLFIYGRDTIKSELSFEIADVTAENVRFKVHKSNIYMSHFLLCFMCLFFVFLGFVVCCFVSLFWLHLI